MSFFYFPKTYSEKIKELTNYYGRRKGGAKTTLRKGSAMMVCLLLLSLFVTLGLGLLLNSQIFFEVQGIRKINRLSSYAAENGIKQSLEKMENKIEELCSETEIEESFFQQLKNQLESGKLDFINLLLTEAVYQSINEFSRMSWKTTATGQIYELENYENYLKAILEIDIGSSGQIQGFNGEKREVAALFLSLYAGHLPLNQIALAVEKTGFKEETRDKLKIISTIKNNLLPQNPTILSGTFIPENALPLISKGLKILKPDRLPNWLLRQALGLEPVNEPVPDGVYLIKDNLGLGGIYVQGPLNELLLGVDGRYQLVQFTQEENRWLLKFDPYQAKTYFYSPQASESFDSLPVPVIMVNGKIESLASGKVNADGYLTASENDLPAFCSGVKLTLVCSGKINITSNLISEGLEWRNGLPYFRSKQSQFIIWSTGKDFQSEELTDGGINLINSSIQNLIISASLIGGGTGIKIDNTITETKIIGSLAANNLNLNSSQVRIFKSGEKEEENGSEADLQVYSERPLFLLNDFRIKEWRSI